MKKVIGIFFAQDGRLRLGWLLAAAGVIYAAAIFGVYYLYWYAYRTMMSVWGVTAQNVVRTPGVIRFWYRWSSVIVQLLQNALLVCAAVGVRRINEREASAGRTHCRLTGAASGLGTGAACIMAVWGVLMLTGSVRLGWRLTRPNFSINTLALLMTSLARAVGEGAFFYGALLGAMKKRLPQWAALLVMSMIGMLVALAEQGFKPMLMMNCALMTLLCCLLTDQSGICCAIGFRLAWEWLDQAVLGFAGASAALYETYPVNMYWLNGGRTGLMGGLLTTVVFMGACGYYLRGRMSQITEE